MNSPVASLLHKGLRGLFHPCSEIILRPFQFCNLSEVVVRADDTAATLATKVRLATILGTFQSTLVDFKYLQVSPETFR